MPSARRAVVLLGPPRRRLSRSGDPLITAVAPSMVRRYLRAEPRCRVSPRWLEALPDNLQDSATAEALHAICDLDLTELQAILPPRGFGRDSTAQHSNNRPCQPALAPAAQPRPDPPRRALPSASFTSRGAILDADLECADAISRESNRCRSFPSPRPSRCPRLTARSPQLRCMHP